VARLLEKINEMGSDIAAMTRDENFHAFLLENAATEVATTSVGVI
jgi:hypothetical protein